MSTGRLRKLVVRCLQTVPTCGGVWSALRTLERTQWLSREQLEDIQIRRLKSLLSHARRTVPYYKDLDSEVFGIKTLEDLTKLPILKRQEVRLQFDRLQSSDAPRGRIARSSGSTGIPVFVRRSAEAIQMTSASEYRAYRWVGFDFGERYGYMSPGTPKNAWARIGQALLGERVLLALLGYFSIDAFNIDRAKLAKFARNLGSRPTVLKGNPSALLLLAKFVDDSRTRPKVRFTLSTSEQLLSQERHRLVSVFDANLYMVQTSSGISLQNALGWWGITYSQRISSSK